MQKLHFSILINAPREKVWKTMLEDDTYRDWTKEFNDPSYYEGTWEKGSNIRFLGPEEDGKVSGMIARINDNRPYEFISIEHLGEVIKSEERLWSEQERGDGIFENYTFTEKDGGTELGVELDSKDEYAEMFTDMWPKALNRLKVLCEE